MSNLKKSIFLTLFVLVAVVAVRSTAHAQDPAATEPSIVDRAASVRVEPASLTMEVGDKTKLEATVLDADGNEIPAPVIFISRSRRNVGVQATGEVEAYRAGEYTIVAIVPQGEDFNPRNANQDGVRAEITVTVPQPALDRVVVTGLPDRMYEGTTSRVKADVFDVTDSIRRDLEATLSVVGDNATVDRFGQSP